MKYIYDILLNYSDMRIFDFYEWYTDDDIEYFKKVPLIKVSDDVYGKIFLGSKLEDTTFLDTIYCVTEIYQNKSVKHVDYACILTNGKEAVAVLFDKNGQIIMLSKMLIDEEDEVLDISTSLNEKNVKLSIDNIENNNINYLTRFEEKKLFFLNKEVDELYDNKNLIKLKYLYYECSNKIENDIDIIYKKIKSFLNSEWSSKHEELYNLVRLSYSKK